jgi:hypothetical protein
MTQNESELAFERAVVEAVGRFAGATDVVCGDRPDGVILVGARRIGVEVVSLQANDWARAQAVMLDEMRPKIEQELKQLGLNVFVEYEIEVPEHFPPEEDRSKAARRKRNQWRNELPAKIGSIAAAGPADLDRKQLEECGLTGLTRLAIQQRVQGPLALPGYRWSSPPPRLLAENLVRAKEEKLAGYRQQMPDLEEVWLALAPFGPGTVEDGGYAWLQNPSFDTPFDRILLVDPADGRVEQAHPKVPAKQSSVR